jgi:hypothetical protein
MLDPGEAQATMTLEEYLVTFVPCYTAVGGCDCETIALDAPSRTLNGTIPLGGDQCLLAANPALSRHRRCMSARRPRPPFDPRAARLWHRLNPRHTTPGPLFSKVLFFRTGPCKPGWRTASS